jgi:acyl carrier protein
MDVAEVRKMVFHRVSELAGVDSSSLGDDATLESVGLDSADAVVLAMEVEQIVSKEIDVGLFLRCATIAEAAAEIAKMVEMEKTWSAAAVPSEFHLEPK